MRVADQRSTTWTWRTLVEAAARIGHHPRVRGGGCHEGGWFHPIALFAGSHDRSSAKPVVSRTIPVRTWWFRRFPPD